MRDLSTKASLPHVPTVYKVRIDPLLKVWCTGQLENFSYINDEAGRLACLHSFFRCRLPKKCTTSLYCHIWPVTAQMIDHHHVVEVNRRRESHKTDRQAGAFIATAEKASVSAFLVLVPNYNVQREKVKDTHVLRPVLGMTLNIW